MLLWCAAKRFQAHLNKDKVLAKVHCQYKCLFPTVEMNKERFIVQEINHWHVRKS